MSILSSRLVRNVHLLQTSLRGLLGERLNSNIDVFNVAHVLVGLCVVGANSSS
jgi:hypothetical protein